MKEIKRVPKTEAELKEKMVDTQIEHFKKAIEEAEIKFGYKLEPAMYYSKMGAFPQIEVVKIKKEEAVKEEEVVV
jgi:hypothetical protein